MSLTSTYQRRLAALMGWAANVAAAAWDQVPTASEQAEDAFVSAVIPAILVAQDQAVIMSDAYLSLFMAAAQQSPLEVKGLDVSQLTGDAARGGTGLDVVYRRPFGVVRGALANGKPFLEAMATGRARVVQAASTDVGLAARAARSAWGAGDKRIQGWRRVVNGGCELCSSAAGHISHRETVMPMHPSCNCVTEPILGPPVAAGALAESLKVVEHGELGPVLYPAGDHFSGT